MLYHNRDRYPLVVVFSETEAVAKVYQKHIPLCYIYNGFSAEALDRIYQRQNAIIDNLPPGLDVPYVLVIIDDCEIRGADLARVRDVWTRGRHRKIGLWINVQDITMLEKKLRINTDWVLCFAEASEQRREAIYSEWMSVLDMRLLHRVYTYYTADRRCLVLRNKALPTSEPRSVENTIMWYRAKTDYGPWLMKSPIMYMVAAMHQLPDAGRPRIDWAQYQAFQPPPVHLKQLGTSQPRIVMRRLNEDGTRDEEEVELLKQSLHQLETQSPSWSEPERASLPSRAVPPPIPIQPAQAAAAAATPSWDPRLAAPSVPWAHSPPSVAPTPHYWSSALPAMSTRTPGSFRAAAPAPTPFDWNSTPRTCAMDYGATMWTPPSRVSPQGQWPGMGFTAVY
jgi:hypothetical protein